MQQILVTDLITDFIDSIKRKDSYIEKSRKFNRLIKCLGPMELDGLREAWAYFETPRADVFPYAFDDTINYLMEQYKGAKIILP